MKNDVGDFDKWYVLTLLTPGNSISGLTVGRWGRECRRWPFNGSTFLQHDLQAVMINCQERGSCHLAYDLCALCPNHLLRDPNSCSSIGTASPPICVMVKGVGNVATPSLLSHHVPAGLMLAICEGTFWFHTFILASYTLLFKSLEAASFFPNEMNTKVSVKTLTKAYFK